MNDTQKKLGFLQMCADKRFHAQVEEKFRQLTGLAQDEYWIEATAGGAPAISTDVTADYAHQHGAVIMGWAAHGDHCGGFPGVSDSDMNGKLDAVIHIRKSRYPDAQHFRIFSTEKGTEGTEVT
jgi:hypothetical protein